MKNPDTETNPGSAPPPAAAPPGHASEPENGDTLLAALIRVGRWHGVTVNPGEAVGALPLVDGRLNPELLLRAAERVGFRARMVKRRLRKISTALLPAIVILKENRVGILEPDEDEDGGGCYLVAEDGSPPARMTARELRKQYSGFVILLRPHGEVELPESAMPAMERAGGASQWFWGTLWKFKTEFLHLIPASVLINLFAISMPIFIMTVYDRVVPNDAAETLWALAIGAAIVFTFEYLMRLLRGSLLTRTGKRLDGVLASGLFDHLMAMEMKARPLSSGILASKARTYESLREFFTSASLVAFVDVPFALLMILVIFYFAGWVAWIPVGATLLSLFIGLLVQGALSRSVGAAYRARLERQSFITETIRGMETVKGVNAQGALQRRMETMIRDASEKEVKSHWFSLLGSSTTTWILHLTTIAVVVACVFRVYDGSLTLGGVIASVILTSRAMTPLAMVTNLMTRFQQTLASLRGLNEIMAVPREYGGGRHFTGHENFKPRFEMKNVTVRYPNQVIPGLDNVSLAIEPGERIALIGRVGSGKSTLLRTLLQLYQPDSGEVILDGLDLPQYHPVQLRRHIGYLPQEITLFNGSVRDNITLGVPWATDDEVLEAVELASMEEFVNHNPAGIYTQIGEQGIRLSGGQRAAVALARCFVARPKILFLDEPTANMDINTEHEVLANLRGYLDEDPERTLLLCTHKLQLLELVDRVIVLDHGKLAEDGPTKDVISRLQARKGRGKGAPDGTVVRPGNREPKQQPGIQKDS